MLDSIEVENHVVNRLYLRQSSLRKDSLVGLSVESRALGGQCCRLVAVGVPSGGEIIQLGFKSFKLGLKLLVLMLELSLLVLHVVQLALKVVHGHAMAILRLLNRILLLAL